MPLLELVDETFVAADVAAVAAAVARPVPVAAVVAGPAS